MSLSKPFITIEEQIELLKKRNVYIGNDDHAERFLLSNGYYSVINGYKDPFIDVAKTKELGEDYYINGTMFTDFEALYLFDEMLRLATRDSLDTAESIMKTASVYAFCFYHQETQAYLNPSSYIDMNEYYNKKDYTRNLIRLLGVLQSRRDNSMNKEYIGHYINKYKEVPLWVVSQALTFGNMSAFYDLQKLNVQNAICRNIEKATNKELKSLKVKGIREDFKILTAYRNICSHGERFYCAKLGKRNQYDFGNLLNALKRILPKANYTDYIMRILDQLSSLNTNIKLKKIIIGGLGVNEQQMKLLLLD